MSGEIIRMGLIDISMALLPLLADVVWLRFI
jgi:hypothetical protein